MYSSGASVKVTASIQDVADVLNAGGMSLDTTRFAGFRGDEAVGAERIVVRTGAIAHAQELRSP